MKRTWMGLAGAVLAVVASAMLARAVNVPLFSGPACSEPSQTLSCMNQIITLYNTQLAAVPQPTSPRNLLDNGAMQVSQRGASVAATCALNGAAITSAAYSADRWGCEVNVGSGNGVLTNITATPTPPIGYTNALKLVRGGGALTQPQCAYQEIPKYKVVQVAGQQVTFSVWEQALAGLAADQGASSQTFNMVIIAGTGADEGFGSWTASPAITPAWTGVSTLVNTSQATPTTPVWARYSTTAAVPTTATELAVAICWTPTAAGQSATDGIAFTGTQLEQGNYTTATLPPYEFRPPAAELAEAMRYFQILTEPAASVLVPVQGSSLSATVANMSYQFPVVMRAAPTFAALGTALANTTWKNNCGNVANALATTFIVTNTANTVSGASLTVTSTGSTIGFGCTLVGAGGGSILSWSADF